MADKVTLPMLKQMKTDGRKIAGLVAYDYQMAQIIDRAGVEIVSVGDSVGHNLFGQQGSLEITLEQMIFVCQAVRSPRRGLLNPPRGADGEVVRPRPVPETTRERRAQCGSPAVRDAGADAGGVEGAPRPDRHGGRWWGCGTGRS